MRILVLLLVIAAAGGLLAAGGSDAKAARALGVSLAEWTLEADRKTVPAGAVTITTRNAGRLEHELSIVRTDLPADKLPQGLEGVSYKLAGKLYLGKQHEHESLDRGTLVNGHIRPGGARRDVVRLDPGRYVLLCNIPGHYGSGQRTVLRVTR